MKTFCLLLLLSVTLHGRSIATAGSTHTDLEKPKRLEGTHHPSKSNSRSKPYQHSKPSEMKKKLSSKNKQGAVTKLYNSLIANPKSARHEINDLIEAVRKNPNIVTSCDEWYLAAHLMRMAKRVDASVPKTIHTECQRVGLLKFSEQMKRMMN